jgi:hypothetical protein
MTNEILELTTDELNLVSGGNIIGEVIKAVVTELVKEVMPAVTAPACGLLGAAGKYTPGCPA